MKSLRVVFKYLSVLILICLLSAASIRVSQALETETAAVGLTGDSFADLVVGVPGQDIPDGASTLNSAGMIHAIYGLPVGLHSDSNHTFDQSVDFAEDSAEAGDNYGNALAAGDFDGDGFYDIAVGVPYENIDVGGSPVVSAGAVHIIYGYNTARLSISGDQFFHQATLNIEGSAEYNDQFGRVLAVGNFNGDAYDDLAIGIPFEDFEYGPTIENAGSVIVIYGSSVGLSATAVLPDQKWHQDRLDIADQVEAYDWFGWALAAGNFDNDDYDDLAIGAPGEDSEAASKNDIGVVHVLYGTADGLTAARDQQWEQYDWGGSAESESYDHFGWSLAVGQFKAHGTDDLVIGVPDEDIEGPTTTVTDAGAINILYGSAGGLTDTVVDFIYQDGGYVKEQAEYQDRFGYTLATVDFGGSNLHDIAVGVPFENLGDPLVTDAGAVHIIYHQFATGWVGDSGRYFHQGKDNIPNILRTGAQFGLSLAPGDYNGDGKEDLAIGVPYDSCTLSDDGAVVVIYDDWQSSPSYPHQYWCQGVNLVDSGQVDDHFGLALAALPGNGVALPERLYLPLCFGDN